MINQKALINAIDIHSHQLEQLKGAVDKLKLQMNGESSETNKYYAIVDKNMIFGNDENLNNISFIIVIVISRSLIIFIIIIFYN